DEGLGPVVGGGQPEDRVVAEDRARDHLGDDERIEIGPDLAAIDAGPEDRLEHPAARSQDPAPERVEQPRFALLLDEQRPEDPDRAALDQGGDRRADEESERRPGVELGRWRREWSADAERRDDEVPLRGPAPVDGRLRDTGSGGDGFD